MNLRHRNLLLPPKERFRTLQQRLNLLLHSLHPLLHLPLLLLLSLSHQSPKPKTRNLGIPRLTEKPNPSPLQRRPRPITSRPQSRQNTLLLLRKGIREKLRYDGGFCYDFIGVDAFDGDFETGDETSWVYVFEVPVWTRSIQVDEDFLEGDLEFREDDVGAVGVGAAVVGVYYCNPSVNSARPSTMIIGCFVQVIFGPTTFLPFFKASFAADTSFLFAVSNVVGVNPFVVIFVVAEESSCSGEL